MHFFDGADELFPPAGAWRRTGSSHLQKAADWNREQGRAAPHCSGKTCTAVSMKVASSGEHGAGRGKGSDGCDCLGHIVSRELGRMWSAYPQERNANGTALIYF